MQIIYPHTGPITGSVTIRDPAPGDIKRITPNGLIKQNRYGENLNAQILDHPTIVSYQWIVRIKDGQTGYDGIEALVTFLTTYAGLKVKVIFDDTMTGYFTNDVLDIIRIQNTFSEVTLEYAECSL